VRPRSRPAAQASDPRCAQAQSSSTSTPSTSTSSTGSGTCLAGPFGAHSCMCAQQRWPADRSGSLHSHFHLLPLFALKRHNDGAYNEPSGCGWVGKCPLKSQTEGDYLDLIHLERTVFRCGEAGVAEHGARHRNATLNVLVQAQGGAGATVRRTMVSVVRRGRSANEALSPSDGERVSLAQHHTHCIEVPGVVGAVALQRAGGREPLRGGKTRNCAPAAAAV
jgi:hypothetical protein